ncbi:sensor histidine kinase [Nocardiopsis mangrovi]|uniref:histidine kinase n=1 Tax=Nocardiopsis mangrovi TaxID=1179818 RepID=A0ABV9E3W0_9ACTN
MVVRLRRAGRVRTAADIGLGAVFAAALAFQASQIAASWGGGYWRFDAAAGAVVCAIALARRYDRAWTAAAGLSVAAAAAAVSRIADQPAEPSPAMSLALSVLVGSAVRTLPPRPACAVAAGGLAVPAGSLAAALASSAGTAVPLLGVAGWLAAVAAGLGPRLLAARRRAMTEEVRRAERLDLARELHDVVAHHIAGIVLMAQAAPIAARTDPGSAAGAFAGIEAAGTDALAATRRVVGLLRDGDDAAPATPGPESLGELVARFERHGPAVELRLPEGEPGWAPEVTSTVHRIVRESLTNIVRHAPHARAVTVDVGQGTDAVAVEVADDAPSAAARHPHRGGYGLVGMRERVESLGGTLHAGPRPGGGWSVRATLPLSENGRP